MTRKQRIRFIPGIGINIISAGAGPAEYILSASADVFIMLNNPNSNYNAPPNGYALRLGNWTDTDNTLIKFDVSPLAGRTVSSAVMYLYCYSAPGVILASTRVRPCLRDWVESQATWNSYKTGYPWEVPGATGTSDVGDVVATLDIAPYSTGWKAWTLPNSLVQSWIDGPNYGLWIGTTTYSINGRYFRSREYNTDVSLRPKLVVMA